MSAEATILGSRTVIAWLSGSARHGAIAWAVATFLLLAALSGGPGISRGEAAVLAAADRSLVAEGEAPPPAPPLAADLAWATRAALAPLGVSTLRGSRLSVALEGALLSAGIVVLAWPLAGPAAALLAPAVFWAAPRHLYAGLVVSPDLLLAALAIALALAWRRATAEGAPRGRTRGALVAGIVMGAALASRADAWTLAAALALDAILSRALRLRDPSPRSSGARVALAAMAVLGPLFLVGAFPALLTSPAARAAAFGVPSAGAAQDALGAAAGGSLAAAVFPLRVQALTLPLPLLLLFAAGPIHCAASLWRALSGRTPREEARSEILLLALALAPLLSAAAGIAPRAGGVRASLQAMPFLAVLGARALIDSARLAWPTRSTPLAASLALLVLWPAIRSTAHFLPDGGAAWSELAGGAPGAASLGLPRQEGGEGVARLIGEIDARAREGARVWWPASSPAAIRVLARDGRLRPDLSIAASPREADIAVVTVDRSGRDDEYRAWAAFGSSRPVAGAYLDEVPLGFVYAAPGAWR